MSEASLRAERKLVNAKKKLKVGGGAFQRFANKYG